MNSKSFLMMSLVAIFLVLSCKKDNIVPNLTFTDNIAEGVANSAGEYTITGHISSEVRLDKVVLTKEGQTTAFLIDDSTAKNKNEYHFSFLVTGITTDTYIIIDVYDQNGGKTTLRFLIKK